MSGANKTSRKRLSPHFSKKNERRIKLILKDLDSGGLTPEEKAEHDELTEWVRAEINRVYPYDYTKLEELERELQRIQKKGRRLRKLLDKLGIK